MSRTQSLSSRPKVIDLTTSIQPTTGAKKLVIKNLRTKSRQDVGEYYQRTWNELDDTLTSIFRRQTPKAPLEVLCRGVEATCRRGEADKLAVHLRDRCKAYLEKELLPKIEREPGSANVEALSTVHKYWTEWNKQATLIRSIFSYLDRSYLLNQKNLLQLEDMGIQQFRHAIFSKSKERDGRKLGGKVIAGMCDLVEFDRARQDDIFDAALLKDSVVMLHIFGIYTKSFEGGFLRRSQLFFEKFSEDRSSSSMKDYVSACDNLLYREALRCDTYNFDSRTKRGLLESAHHILIEQRTNILLDAAGLAGLLDASLMSSLRALYKLLCLSNLQQDLKQPFETYIKETGAMIVRNPDKVDEMVVRLLELKRSLDLIIRDAFEKDETFSYSLREAFGNFINDSKNTTAWGTGNSKVGEMIAKYMDTLLRGGLKAVPPSLASDAKDRDAAEKQGQASTGDEDAELDRQLEQALELFRFIEGKDVFEAFYKKDLARRLLMSRSASQDAERTMLAKLKTECGFTFTHNLEQMFKDQELAREEMASYKETLEGKPNIDLSVNVLSAAAWPTYPDVEVNLPRDVADIIARYDRHYKHKHTGRRLTWKHALAHSVVKATFKKGPRELLVSAFQAIVLVLFNDADPQTGLSYKTIQSSTGLVDNELQRTLQSLACGKFRILTKSPKGRDVNPDDNFTFNQSFWEQKYRIKINQIQLKETKEENKETHERVQQDRQYETQAAIVRIMKSRKTITHANLVSEVIEQTKKRGAVELSEIKKNIEKLIEKEYIDREEGGLYTYVA
ncbi:Cullin-domain-containing protein [Mollisia scopiformis]|uniref:Cullin-domain-containing protein n=1 Tax=Mollisia scopiformis TaxID=149040 RepID=A0A132BBW7_MOLSC|nr:Cullin-domain-containing protein [Mollisia scopiformis]KUJ09922.1 Cullin-domain-containing protein [Mollisia scopiformis]